MSRKRTSSHLDCLMQRQLQELRLRMNRRELLIVGGVTLAGLLSGCGSGDGAASSTGGISTRLAPFQISPASGAPGSMVTLTGISVAPGAAINVTFGDAPAIVHAQDSTGLQVLVPAWINPATMESAPPSQPMTVTVNVGSSTVKSTNQFTALPLPASPGTGKALSGAMADMAAFFQSFFGNGIVPALSDPSNPGGSIQAAGPAIQGAALCTAAMDFYSNASNPNSFVSMLTSLEGSGASGTALVALYDALAAQGPMAGLMQSFATTMIQAIEDIAPDAVVTNPSARAATRDEVVTAFKSVSVDWSKIDAARRIVVEIQCQKLLSAVASSQTSTVVQAAISLGLMFLALLEVATTGPLAPAALGITAIALDLGGKLLSCMASLMASHISDFYVLINNTARRTGDPAVTIPVSQKVPLRVELVAATAGGLSFTLLGAVASASSVAGTFFPPLKAFLSAQGDVAIVKTVAESVLGVFDSIWQFFSSGPPPQQWYSLDAFNFPSTKFPPVNVNTISVITIVSNSPRLLQVAVDANRAYYLTGLTAGSNAGYVCYVDKKSMTAGLPQLADILAEKWVVKGVVNITAGTVQLNLS